MVPAGPSAPVSPLAGGLPRFLAGIKTKKKNGRGPFFLVDAEWVLPYDSSPPLFRHACSSAFFFVLLPPFVLVPRPLRDSGDPFGIHRNRWGMWEGKGWLAAPKSRLRPPPSPSHSLPPALRRGAPPSSYLYRFLAITHPPLHLELSLSRPMLGGWLPLAYAACFLCSSPWRESPAASAPR